ncbi:MAG TPA: hypothetical protein VMG58_10960 [Candidatus Sulfotelmatobacter sp.]|nr:hypothetical protein [Candidatus Sulfotelmatobacter sp.]
MKKLFAASLFAAVLTSSTAFAALLPSIPQPIKGTEGPDVAFQLPQTEQPIKGTEGPDVAFQLPSKQDSIPEPEGPDVQ